MRSRIYLADKVTNQDFRFGQAPEYFPVMIVSGARRTPALLTHKEICRAMERAGGNKEDIPQPGLWQRIKTWFTAR